jgi:transcriptional regulator with XRE-family HTH domain
MHIALVAIAMSHFRLRIRELREALNLTQEQLAECAGGIRIATISAYESSQAKRPDLRVLEKLCCSSIVMSPFGGA